MTKQQKFATKKQGLRNKTIKVKTKNQQKKQGLLNPEKKNNNNENNK